MIVKNTAQLGNFRRGINLYIPRRFLKQIKDAVQYIFLAGSNNTIETFLNNSETVFGASGIGTEIYLNNLDGNGFKTYLRRTSTSWRDGNNATVNSLVINPGGIFTIIRSLTGIITVQGTNKIRKILN